MAIILNIDTSSKTCSVALTVNGEVVVGLESKDRMDHSTVLAPFVKECFDYLEKEKLSLEAVSVVAGPGSYTGLRIGLSLAKGLAYSLDVPLITLSSLEVMTIGVMFSYSQWEGEEIVVPMIDARRNEVFTCVFDAALNHLKEEQPLILDEDSFNDLYSAKKVIFAGDGSEKFKHMYQGENALWMPEKMSHARFMGILSEKYFKQRKFADVAYSTPNYLKEYYSTVKPLQP